MDTGNLRDPSCLPLRARASCPTRPNTPRRWPRRLHTRASSQDRPGRLSWRRRRRRRQGCGRCWRRRMRPLRTSGTGATRCRWATPCRPACPPAGLHTSRRGACCRSCCAQCSRGRGCWSLCVTRRCGRRPSLQRTATCPVRRGAVAALAGADPERTPLGQILPFALPPLVPLTPRLACSTWRIRPRSCSRKMCPAGTFVRSPQPASLPLSLGPCRSFR